MRFYHTSNVIVSKPDVYHSRKHLDLRVINYLIVLLFVVVWGNGRAQTVIGTVGMMNVPTADMRPAGTFDGGACIVQKELLYQKSYYTCLYYIDFTPFSWLEVTLRETLIKTRKSQTEPDKIGFYQQDKVGIKEGITYDGFMGGLSFVPAFFPNMRIMGEYDTDGFNVGASVFLLRHLNMTCFTREFKGFNATLVISTLYPINDLRKV